jgi:hypothetical protein
VVIDFCIDFFFFAHEIFSFFAIPFHSSVTLFNYAIGFDFCYGLGARNEKAASPCVDSMGLRGF